MGSQKLRQPSNKKFTTSIVRGFQSPMDASITTPCPCLDACYGGRAVSSVLDAASSAGQWAPGVALSKKPLHSLLAAFFSSACLPILDVLSTPKFAVASGETHDKNNGQHWCSPLSLCARFCDGQRRLLEAPERRDQADDRRPSRRALRRCAGAAAAAAGDRDACSGTRACDGIVVVLR